MKLVLKNIDISRVVAFLEGEDLKGQKSINRSRVTNHLTEELEKISEGEQTIRDDFKDDHKTLEKELKEFFNQTYTIEGDNWVKPLNVVKTHIKEITSDESDRSFKDEAAYAVSVLYEAFKIDLEGGDE